MPQAKAIVPDLSLIAEQDFILQGQAQLDFLRKEEIAARIASTR